MPVIIQINRRRGPLAKDQPYRGDPENYFWSRFCGDGIPPLFYDTQNSAGTYLPKNSSAQPAPIDLYTLTYHIINSPPPSVPANVLPPPNIFAITSDFDGAYSMEATKALVEALRERHVRLIVITGKMAAYPGLAEYARESGGYYALLNFNCTGLSYDPVLPVATN